MELDPVRKALAFAIAERYKSVFFVENAISCLADVDLSISLAAYNYLLALPRDIIRPAEIKQIKDAISRSPEREVLTGFNALAEDTQC